MTDTNPTTWDPNGAIVGAESFGGDSPMYAGAPTGYVKGLTLDEAARAFRSGSDIIGGESMGGPSNPFRQVSWVYACVNAIASRVGRVPIRLSQGDAAGTRGVFGCKRVRSGRAAGRRTRGGDDAVFKAVVGEIVEGGDLHDLLRRPNLAQRWNEFLEITIGLLYRDGRVHWLFDDMTGRRPGSMYCVSGRATTPITDKSGRVEKLVGWKINKPGGGQDTILLEECVTFQLFNPDDPHAGMSPRTPASLAIVSHYNADLYNAAMFGNSCEPGGVLRTDAPFNKDQDEQLRTTFQQRHGGAINARRLAVLWGGMQYEATASTMVEMQYTEGLRMRREDIAVAYGVPLAVLGVLGTTGDSVAYVDAEEERFWQDTIAILLEKIADGIADNIAPLFPGDVDVWADIEDVPVIQRMRRARTDAAERYFKMGVAMEDLNDWLDLGLPEQDHHATAYVTTAVQTVDQAQQGFDLPPLDEGDGDASTDGDASSDDDKSVVAGEPRVSPPVINKGAAERLWKRWQASWAPLATKMAAMVANHTHAQCRKIRKLLRDYAPSAQRTASQRCVKDNAIVARVLVDVFGDAADRQKFTARVERFSADAAELGLRQALVEAGVPTEQLADKLSQLLASPRITAAISSGAVRISTTIDSSTRRALRKSLSAGVEAGESGVKLADRVSEYVGGSRTRSLGIARNAVAETLSMSRREGRVAGGLTHETWISSRGPGERRPAHLAAERRYAAAPKPIADAFEVNGVKMQYPRDPAAPIGERANCQCLAIGMRIAPGSDGARAVWAATVVLTQRGFQTYNQMLTERRAAETAASEGATS